MASIGFGSSVFLALVLTHSSCAEETVPCLQLVKLQTLELRDCTSLAALPDVSWLVKLEELRLKGCTSLAALPDVSSLEELRNVCKPVHLPTPTFSPGTFNIWGNSIKLWGE